MTNLQMELRANIFSTYKKTGLVIEFSLIIQFRNV